ncbi:hypothetical protein Tco_0571638, partial [Tanacetum coccineum]
WIKRVVGMLANKAYRSDPLVYARLVVRVRCVWLPGYTSALQIADVFGFAWFRMILLGYTSAVADVFGSAWVNECGATIHVCYDQSMFKTHTAASEDKKVLLGDPHTTNVASIGNVELKFTSRETVILVMHTPKMRKNLASGLTSVLGIDHWDAIERVMRYLKKTMNLRLHYNKFSCVLEGYNDADPNTLSDDSKATNDYIFSLAGGAVSWKSKKQTNLSQSSITSHR